MADGELRRIFRSRVPEAHWQSVESWSTGQGVPDVEYCLDGASGWVECKKATTAGRLDHPLSPHQSAWLERRRRAGGRAFVAVRFRHGGGPRKGPPVDDLIVYDGSVARLLEAGVDGAPWLGRWHGGPAGWDWQAFRQVLRK